MSLPTSNCRVHIPLLTLAFATLVSARGVTQDRDVFPQVPPENAGLSSAKLREAVAVVEKWTAEQRIMGAVLLVIRDGKTVLHEAIGWSDRERRIPLRTDHILSMRSMTKPLVGTAALMLREAGKLKLEDRVAQYLPSFDNPRSREITVFQLLTHTSGIKGEIYVGTGGSAFRTLREAVDAVGQKGPDSPPGTEYSYSDPGTSTLGAVIAERSGMPAEDFIRTRILEPLGMKDSFLVDVGLGRPQAQPDYHLRGAVPVYRHAARIRAPRVWGACEVGQSSFFGCAASPAAAADERHRSWANVQVGSD